jgi:putative transposase
MRDAGNVIYIHIVWTTWDRLPLITAPVQILAYRAIGAKCQELKTEVVALGGIEDHVHLLIHLHASLSVADLVRHVKGASSHLVTHERTDIPFFKWQGSYGAVSVSPADLPRISQYVANQRDHHDRQTLIPEWEYPLENAGTGAGEYIRAYGRRCRHKVGLRRLGRNFGRFVLTREGGFRGRRPVGAVSTARLAPRHPLSCLSTPWQKLIREHRAIVWFGGEGFAVGVG